MSVLADVVAERALPLRSLGQHVLTLCVALTLLAVTDCAAHRGDALLRFSFSQGLNLNYFIRDGRTAAHLVLRSGRNPRLLVAFPAGDGGAAVWFEPSAAPADWLLDSPPEAKADKDSRRPLYGIDFDVSIAAPTGCTRRGGRGKPVSRVRRPVLA